MNQPKKQLIEHKEDSTANHSRTDTTLVKDIHQSYQFISALSKCEDDSVNLDFSITAPECSYSDFSDVQASTVTLKPFESVTEMRRNKSRRGSSIDFFEGTSKYIPKKLYCPQCKAYENTRINYFPQRVGFWKKLFCNECLTHSTQYQAIYSCKLCKLVLTKVDCSFKV